MDPFARFQIPTIDEEREMVAAHEESVRRTTQATIDRMPELRAVAAQKPVHPDRLVFEAVRGPAEIGDYAMDDAGEVFRITGVWARDITRDKGMPIYRKVEVAR